MVILDDDGLLLVRHCLHVYRQSALATHFTPWSASDQKHTCHLARELKPCRCMLQRQFPVCAQELMTVALPMLVHIFPFAHSALNYLHAGSHEGCARQGMQPGGGRH